MLHSNAEFDGALLAAGGAVPSHYRRLVLPFPSTCIAQLCCGQPASRHHRRQPRACSLQRTALQLAGGLDGDDALHVLQALLLAAVNICQQSCGHLPH